MGVRIVSMSTMEQPVVVGELTDVVNAMNIASAQGMKFIICEKADSGRPIAIELKNITLMDEEDDALIG